MTDNYKVIADRLANREPFNGNSLRAVLEQQSSELKVYKVYSYNTLIAKQSLYYSDYVAYSDGWVSWVCPKKYSVTTSRAQNLIRRVWAID